MVDRIGEGVRQWCLILDGWVGWNDVSACFAVGCFFVECCVPFCMSISSVGCIVTIELMLIVKSLLE